MSADPVKSQFMSLYVLFKYHAPASLLTILSTNYIVLCLLGASVCCLLTSILDWDPKGWEQMANSAEQSNFISLEDI